MFKAFVQVLDGIYLGSYLWALRRAFLERKLAKVLEEAGEDSHLTRYATNQWRRADWGLRFGRSPTPCLVAITPRLLELGLTKSEIKLLVVSNNLREKNGQVLISKLTWQVWIARFSSAFVTIQWIFLVSFTLLLPGDAWKKMLVMVGISIMYLVLWRGWALHCNLAVKTLAHKNSKISSAAQWVNGQRATCDLIALEQYVQGCNRA